MNLTVNIPIDFTDLEGCRQILIRSGINWESATKIISGSAIGRFGLDELVPMTPEEINFITSFSIMLKLHCVKMNLEEENPLPILQQANNIK